MLTTIDRNLLFQTDSYKWTHWRQYKPGTHHVYSYLESRGGAFDELVWFGLKYYLRHFLAGVVFDADDIVEAADVAAEHFGDDTLFNLGGWTRLLNKHGGTLPVRIKAIPEGTVVSPGVPLMTVENTDPDFPWLPGVLESLLLKVWYPMTVASQSRAMAQIIKRHLERTGDPSLLPYKVHDFGYRGVSSEETAEIGGAAHLTIFRGTDTLPALLFLRRYYGAGRAAGHSIAATEHSTITSWGGPEQEVDAFRHFLQQHPRGTIACVSDSFNIWRACSEHWGTTLKAQVLARDGTLVVRPDSGDPIAVVPRVLELLGEKFGFKVNNKGYKVLNPKVRVIQGDGVDLSSIGAILSAAEAQHWSADNITFGCGGALLQKLHRDTCKVALKCSAAEIGGTWRDVQKDPITDQGKRSKAGRFEVHKAPTTGRLIAVREDTPRVGFSSDYLRCVFLNGVVQDRDDMLTTIRERAAV